MKERFAIVATGIRLPGAASLDQLWEVLSRGLDLSREVPHGRWPRDAKHYIGVGDVDQIPHARGNFLDDDSKDPELDAALDAWAGVKRPKPERTAVIIGHLALPRKRFGVPGESSSLFAEPATRIKRALRLGGDALVLDAACASSLYSLKLACNQLADQKIDAVICGGVSRADSLYTQMGFARLRALSADGVCRPFDVRGNGLVVGEGVGLFVVKRLVDAIRDDETILAVVRAVGLSNDTTAAIMSPCRDGQLRAMRDAYESAGLAPWDVDAIEAHATGTPLGDATEAQSLTSLWRGAPKGARAVLGSVKGNIGHLLTAAGASSVAKVLASFKEGRHAPIANLTCPIDALSDAPFDLLTEPRNWPRRSQGAPRRAAINGFGFGGINAHVILESFEEDAMPVGRVNVSNTNCKVEDIEDVEVVGEFVLEDWDKASSLAFPAHRFRIPPRELSGMLPQQLLFLRAADEAMRRAAIPRHDQWRAGAIIGTDLDDATTQHAKRWTDEAVGEDADALTQDRTLGGLASVAASRVAKCLGLGGASFAVGHDEHPGIAAHEVAANLLRSRELDLAIVGDIPVSRGRAFVKILRRKGSKIYNSKGRPRLLRGQCASRAQLGETLARLAEGHDDMFTSKGPWRWSLVVEEARSVADVAGQALSVFRTLPIGAPTLPVMLTPDAWIGHGDSRATVAFLYPGSGAGYPDPTLPLAATYDRAWERSGLAEFVTHQDVGIRGEMSAQCVHGIFATTLLKEFGVSPAFSVGYSLGESTALLALGVWTDRRAVFARLMNSPLFVSDVVERHDFVRKAWNATQDIRWVNALVRRSASEVRQALDGKDRVYLCNVNTPRECVVGGDEPSVRAVVSCLGDEWREIRGMPSLHNAAVMHAGDAIRAFHRHESSPLRGVVFFGGGRPGPYLPTSECAADAIAAHCTNGVDFLRSIEAARDHGARIFIEIGPGLSLTRMVGECLGTRSHVRVALSASCEHEITGLSRILALAHASGYELSADVDEPEAKLIPLRGYDMHQARPWLDWKSCKEFAGGKIGKVLGPDFAPIDAYPSRVRLPDGPLLLCHRIMKVEGAPRSLGPGRLVTQHDVCGDAWYLDQGVIPTSIAVEAGQADLFLSAYLGADFHTRGEARYRLLDAVVTFHDRLPRAGSTITYDIRIERFFVQGGSLFFNFGFEASVDGRPLLSMRDGAAGFFTPRALDEGRGVMLARLNVPSTKATRAISPLAPPSDGQESLSEENLAALRRGDYVGCFGTAFSGSSLTRPATLPDGMLRLVHRIVSLDTRGGRFGLGRVVGEADIAPDDWFLTCHFVDDPVMPGTLMYECCNHTLRVLTMRLGWIGEVGELTAEPVVETGARLKCRGQVLPTTNVVRYEIDVKEIGYAPDAYAIADAIMYADGKPIVEIKNLSLRHVGYTEARANEIWRLGDARRAPSTARPRAIFDRERILAYAEGAPSEAFGDRYKIFDDPQGRRLARLPRPPFLFVDSVETNAEPWRMEAEGSVRAAWCVPRDAWFFEAHGARSPLPFAVLLEAALQPCGFFSAYMGSALNSDVDLSYRNLGGKATLHRNIGSDVGVLTTNVTCTNVSASGGMILQSFEFAVSDSRGVVYDGETMFGFFSKASLAQQVGLRDAVMPASPANAPARAYPDKAHMPRRPWLMLDRILHLDVASGRDLKGLVIAEKHVDPKEWFFAAHFYQDPVMPGSLGLEALLQAAVVLSEERWPRRPGGFHALQPSSHEWLYRGQVLPTHKAVRVSVESTNVDDSRRQISVSGLLETDGRTIYRAQGFVLAARDS